MAGKRSGKYKMKGFVGVTENDWFEFLVSLFTAVFDPEAQTRWESAEVAEYSER